MAVPPVVSRFIAGTDVDSAVEYAETKYQQTGINPMLNLLGEHYTDEAAVHEDVQTYIDVAHALTDSDISDPCISVKPSQMGLDITPALFAGSVETILDNTTIRVWVDMESHSAYKRTVAIVERIARKYPGRVGLCLQANIKETPQTLERLAGLDMKIRLVKGAYNEPEIVAHTSKEAINTAYRNCIQKAFSEFADTPTGLAIGSHHEEMLQYAHHLQQSYNLSSFEVQMLMGVREERQSQLIDDVDVYQYIPFGSSWLSYFYRRVRESKSNLFFAVRAIFSR